MRLDLNALITALEGKRARAAEAMLAGVEAFWVRQAAQEVHGWLEGVVRAYRRVGAHGLALDGALGALGYSPVGTAAYGMLHCLALGGWSGVRVCEEERAKVGEAASPPVPLSLAERPLGRMGSTAAADGGNGSRDSEIAPTGVAAGADAEVVRLSERDWRSLNKALGKVRVGDQGRLDIPRAVAAELRFPAAFGRVFGIQPEYARIYVEERLPPIVGATEELQARVRDAVARAGREVWDPEQLRRELQKIGGWSEARITNQMRTESGHFFERGRFENFARDEAIVGYWFLVTVDRRTTKNICLPLVGKVVRADELQDIPPFHYMCRTRLVPVFAWSAEGKRLRRSGGDGSPEIMEGFGQGGFVAELKKRVAEAINEAQVAAVVEQAAGAANGVDG